jgi:hypothetical protein
VRGLVEPDPDFGGRSKRLSTEGRGDSINADLATLAPEATPEDASVSDRSRHDHSKITLVSSFKLLSEHRAVELRAAQQMLIPFTRLKSSRPPKSSAILGDRVRDCPSWPCMKDRFNDDAGPMIAECSPTVFPQLRTSARVTAFP